VRADGSTVAAAKPKPSSRAAAAVICSGVGGGASASNSESRRSTALRIVEEMYEPAAIEARLGYSIEDDDGAHP
jgi:hypothetical protein